MRTDAIVEMNRGRVSGWIIIAGVLLAFLALVSFTAPLDAVLIAVVAAGLLAAGIWIQLPLHRIPKPKP